MTCKPLNEINTGGPIAARVACTLIDADSTGGACKPPAADTGEATSTIHTETIVLTGGTAAFIDIDGTCGSGEPCSKTRSMRLAFHWRR